VHFESSHHGFTLKNSVLNPRAGCQESRPDVYFLECREKEALCCWRVWLRMGAGLLPHPGGPRGPVTSQLWASPIQNSSDLTSLTPSH
jgi:hypothetical protein